MTDFQGLGLRPPRPSYAGKDGFENKFTNPDELTESNIYSALQAHHNALFVLEEKKRPVPDFESMKAWVEANSDELRRVKERIKTLKEDHVQDLQRLYARHAREFKEDALNKYISSDEYLFKDGKLSSPTDAKLKEAISGPFNDTALELAWKNEHEQLRHTYLVQLLALERRRRQIENSREEDRKRREKMFPESKEDFFKKPGDIQLRAANFLLAKNEQEEERFLVMYGWASRQVQPLKEIFKKDEAFASDVRAMVLSHQNVKDPRIRA